MIFSFLSACFSNESQPVPFFVKCFVSFVCSVTQRGGVSFDILFHPGLVHLTYSYGGLLICIRNIHFSLFALVWQAVMFCL